MYHNLFLLSNFINTHKYTQINKAKIILRIFLKKQTYLGLEIIDNIFSDMSVFHIMIISTQENKS